MMLAHTQAHIPLANIDQKSQKYNKNTKTVLAFYLQYRMQPLCKILLNSMHFKMIEARKSFNNFDAKVTLGTTLTQFERIKHEIE